jgi:hypothetical protein
LTLADARGYKRPSARSRSSRIGMPRIPPSLVIRSHNPARLKRFAWVLLAVWLASLALVAVLAVEWSKHRLDLRGAAGRDAVAEQVEAAKTRIAMLERSEQVAKAAVEEMQATLKERDEEIESLRSDLAFYGRLVGGSERQGLAVPQLRLEPVVGSHAWNFTATITQNFKRDAEMRGRLSLAVEGVTGGKLQVLDWDALQQRDDAPRVDYAFKYFQRVSGTIMLPPDFEPNRVRVHLDGNGARVEQEFAWEDAIKREETTDVRQ